MRDKKLTKNLKARIEALVIAIAKETASHEYYIELMKGCKDEASQEMFRFLLKQELEHKETLEKMLADLQEQLERAMAK